MCLCSGHAVVCGDSHIQVKCSYTVGYTSSRTIRQSSSINNIDGSLYLWLKAHCCSIDGYLVEPTLMNCSSMHVCPLHLTSLLLCGLGSLWLGGNMKRNSHWLYRPSCPSVNVEKGRHTYARTLGTLPAHVKGLSLKRQNPP